MEFFNYTTISKPQRGDLLISEPFLPDPNFERTVILLCEHNEEGSFGFVLNKQSVLKFNDVIQEVAVTYDADLYVGGPVEQNTLHFIHNHPVLIEGGLAISNDVYWGGNFEQLIKLINKGDISTDYIRYFVGYSGWTKDQLEMEIRDNSWIVARGVHPSYIFEINAEQLWKKILENMGGRFKVYANYPPNPNLN